MRLPSGSPSPFCYWHRLARTSPHGQEIEAQRRRDGARVATESELAAIRLAPDGSWRWCNDCTSHVPRWYADGPRCKACARLARRLRTSPPGFTPDLVRDLMTIQAGRCAICRNRQQRQALARDHDHHTNRPRGLLCDRCNKLLLGGAHDSLRILRNAVYYLERPPTSGLWKPPEAR